MEVRSRAWMNFFVVVSWDFFQLQKTEYWIHIFIFLLSFTACPMFQMWLLNLVIGNPLLLDFFTEISWWSFLYCIEHQYMSTKQCSKMLWYLRFQVGVSFCFCLTLVSLLLLLTIPSYYPPSSQFLSELSLILSPFPIWLHTYVHLIINVTWDVVQKDWRSNRHWVR